MPRPWSSSAAADRTARARSRTRGAGPRPASEPSTWSPWPGAARRLAEGHSPLPHPRENRIVFVDKNQVFALDLAEGAKPERLFGARGSLGSLRFSADGALLAFVSDRGDHAFVGVYDVAAKSVRWMDPGVDRDGEPAFSPDGKSLAFLRLPAQKDAFVFGAEREGEPWSIRVAEVASGQSREVFRADKGPGSVFAEVDAPNQVLWGAGDRLVFPWEKTGWRHLYSVPAAGGPPIGPHRRASSRSSTFRRAPTAPRSSTARTPTTSTGDTSGRCPWPGVCRRPSPPAPASSGRR